MHKERITPSNRLYLLSGDDIENDTDNDIGDDTEIIGMRETQIGLSGKTKRV